jgi:hypothetical protein
VNMVQKCVHIYVNIKMIHVDKGGAYTGDMGIGRKPKTFFIWCPHCRGINTETLKQQRSTWEGDQEPV